MIGKIITGKSFRGCLLYCLQNKKVTAITKDRAEVLLYNRCYGSARELIKEFNDVRNLNLKVSKPVLHITLSLSPGERLTNFQLAEIGQQCASDLRFEKNQFLVVQHTDTNHQHIHIIANRIGFDGKAVTDSNNYQKIANFCRKMERHYQLRQVLNPRRFMDKKLRETPRIDARKQKLKSGIMSSLKTAQSFSEFQSRMKTLGYSVIKGRGIAFRDGHQVYTKGSEVGYSLARIEQMLGMTLSERKQRITTSTLPEVKKEGIATFDGVKTIEGNRESKINIKLDRIGDIFPIAQNNMQQPDDTQLRKFKRKRRRQKL